MYDESIYDHIAIKDFKDLDDYISYLNNQN